MSATSNYPYGYTGDPPPYCPSFNKPFNPVPAIAWGSTPFVDSELAKALINALKGETTIKVQVELSPENIEQLRKLIAPQA